MTAEEVLAKVEAEIGDDWDLSNEHSVDLKTSVVRPPELRLYQNSLHLSKQPCDRDTRRNAPKIQLWLVLYEHPDTKKGYVIVYDEVDDLFGLAAGDTFVAHYGTFLETLEAM